MKILAGPDDWAPITGSLRLGLDGLDAKVFSQTSGELDFVSGQTTLESLTAQLPDGWGEPDWFVWWLPEYQHLLPNLENCSARTLLVISDWHLLSDPLCQVASAFDLVATTAAGVKRLEQYPGVNAFVAPLTAYVPEFHQQLEFERDVPVGYLGDFEAPHTRRARQMAALAIEGLQEQEVQLFPRVYGPEVSAYFSRFRITLTHSTDGEFSQDGFAAMACGSLLFCEDSNREVGDYFKDGEHCVLYNEDNLTEKLRHYLDHPEELARIAQAGQQAVNQYNCREQTRKLFELAQAHYRPNSRNFLALPPLVQKQQLCTYHCEAYALANPSYALQLAEQAHAEHPEDPLLKNLVAVQSARVADLGTPEQAVPIIDRAVSLLESISSLGPLPQFSLASLHLRQGRREKARQLLTELLVSREELIDVPFYRSLLHPIDRFWQLFPSISERKKSLTWLALDLLSGLQFEKNSTHTRRAVRNRPEAALSWFRLALCEELKPRERLRAVNFVLKFEPFFWPAHFLKLRIGAGHHHPVQQRAALAAAFAMVDSVWGSNETYAELDQALDRLLEPPPTVSHKAPAKEFLQAITFRLFHSQKVPHRLYWYENFAHLELLNTRFPAQDQALKKRLAPLLGISRDSTLALAGIVNHGVRNLPQGSSYLSLGTGHGFMALAGMVDNPEKSCVTVGEFSSSGEFAQNWERWAGPAHRFHETEPSSYFENHGDPVGLFWNGLPDPTIGWELAEPRLVPGALILLPNINSEETRRSIEAFLQKSSRAYRLLKDEPTAFPGHATWWNGIMILELVDAEQ